jgi:hypothetical protein
LAEEVEDAVLVKGEEATGIDLMIGRISKVFWGEFFCCRTHSLKVLGGGKGAVT